MMAPAMPEAISAYSIAVAPLSLRRKSRNRRIVRDSFMDASSLLVTRYSQQRHQMRDQRHVRRRHWVFPQPVRFYPGELLSLGGGDLSFPAPADIERHQEMEVGIGVACESQRRET